MRDIEPLDAHGERAGRALRRSSCRYERFRGVATWTTSSRCCKRSARPTGKLTREQFDLVLEMLAGRYAGSPRAQPRSFGHRGTTASTARCAARAERGVCHVQLRRHHSPDRGYYRLRHAETGTVHGRAGRGVRVGGNRGPDASRSAPRTGRSTAHHARRRSWCARPSRAAPAHRRSGATETHEPQLPLLAAHPARFSRHTDALNWPAAPETFWPPRSTKSWPSSASTPIGSRRA